MSELESAIKDIVGKKSIEIVYDAVSNAETQQVGWDVLEAGGTLVLAGPASPIDKKGQEDSKHISRSYGGVSLPANLNLGEKLYASLTEWLESGIILVRLKLYWHRLANS